MGFMHFIHYTGAFALFAAMALLVVASVSSPIWNNVGYLKGEVAGRGITFGNWGWCFSGSACTSAKLGYPRGFISALANSGANVASENVLHNLSYVLILTPIAAGVSFLAFLFALPTKLVFGILGSILAFLAFLVTIVDLGILLGLFITTRNRINNLGVANTHVSLSSCVWLVVAAAGCQLWATITVCFTRSRKRRAAREDEFATVPAMTSAHNNYSNGAPSTVGSTGPLVHDHTGVNGYDATEANTGYNSGTTYTTTGYAEPIGAHGTEGHAWQRQETTRI